MCYVQEEFCYICVLLHVEIKYRRERRTLGIMDGFAQLLNKNKIYCQTQNISELTVN